MPVWLQILITSVVVPGGGFALKVLYQTGKVMGEVMTQLEGHNQRLDKLENKVFGS